MHLFKWRRTFYIHNMEDTIAHIKVPSASKCILVMWCAIYNKYIMYWQEVDRECPFCVCGIAVLWQDWLTRYQGCFIVIIMMQYNADGVHEHCNSMPSLWVYYVLGGPRLAGGSGVESGPRLTCHVWLLHPLNHKKQLCVHNHMLRVYPY